MLEPVFIVAVCFGCLQYVPVPYEAYLRADPNSKYNPDLPVSEQIDCLAYDSAWEFPKECLKFG